MEGLQSKKKPSRRTRQIQIQHEPGRQLDIDWNNSTKHGELYQPFLVCCSLGPPSEEAKGFIRFSGIDLDVVDIIPTDQGTSLAEIAEISSFNVLHA